MHIPRTLGCVVLVGALLFMAAPAAAQLNERYLCVDGTNDYAVAPDHATLDLGTGANDDFTLETFFYVPDTSNTTFDTLIWKDGAYALYIVYNFSLAGGADRFVFRIWTGVGANDYVFLFHDVHLSVGWHHVAAIWDNENTATWDYMAMYVDGTLGASGSNIEMTPGTLNTSSGVYIGAVNGTNPAAGGFEDTRLSNVVRYTGSSFSVPSSPFTTDANTAALWHYDAAPGATSFVDSSGNGNTLTGHNGAQICGAACLTITVSPTTLSGGTHGTPYNDTLTASGGTAPYTFAVTAGALPPGLDLSSSGVLSGTPSSAGMFEFTVTATDSGACTGEREYTVLISCPVITVTPATLPDGVNGAAYNSTIDATGGTSPYSFAVTSGSLPPGLTLAANGQLSGTPTTDGSYGFTVTATDDQACTGDREYTLDVVSPTPTVIVEPTSLTVAENGATDDFTVVLGYAASGNVVVDVVSNDTSEATVSHAQLTFNAGNWSSPQTVTVTPVNDALIDGDQNAAIVLTMNVAATTDPLYDPIDPDDVAVTVTDDEALVIVSTLPPGNTRAAARTTNIQATANDSINPATVTQPTFRIQGSLSGRINGAFSTSGASFHLNPTNNLKPGETVRVTATAGIASTSGASLRPRVWEFTAATGTAGAGIKPHPTTPTFGAGDSTAVALGDLDGDGDVDAMIGNYDVPMSVWRNDGAGNFTPHPSVPTFGLTETEMIALGDLDSDGDLDAVVSRRYGLQWPYLNDGTGGFTAHPTIPQFGAINTTGVALGDLDGDGDLDAVASHITAQSGTVWLNGGSGDFTAHPTTPGFGGEMNCEGVALGDLDLDGDLDAVIAHTAEEAETVWLNDGSGNFSAHPTTASFGGGSSLALALGDLDADGDLDAVVANDGSPETVWVNDGGGNFSAHPTAASFDAGFNRELELGDIDGDGDLDMALVGSGGAFDARLWRNDGSGNFTGFARFINDQSTELAFADLDGDNDLDFVVSHLTGPERVWLNVNPGILVTPTSGHQTTEAGGTSTFDMVLLSYPLTTVGVQVESSNMNEGRLTHDGVGPASGVPVVFATYDWDIPKTVTIIGQDDSIDDGDVAYTIVTAAATGSDPVYNGINAADVSVINRDDDGPPSFLTATATSTTQVALSWGAVGGATSYEVHRATTKTGAFTIVGTPVSNAFVDTVPTANTTYIYKVRRSGGGPADFSPIDIATSIVFTDPTLTGLKVRAVHLQQLRTAVNAVRIAAEVGAATFTDPTLTAATKIKRIHIIELRTALNAARTSLALPAITYTDPTITALVTKIKQAHINELRQGTQ